MARNDTTLLALVAALLLPHALAKTDGYCLDMKMVRRCLHRVRSRANLPLAMIEMYLCAPTGLEPAHDL